MRIRQFTGPDIATAMRTVKKALGPEAIILARRDKVARDGRRTIEITAAVDEASCAESTVAQESRWEQSSGTSLPGMRNHTAVAMEELASEVAELKRAMRQLAGGHRRSSIGKLGGSWLGVYDQLCARGILPHIACDLVMRSALAREREGASMEEKLCKGVGATIPLGGQTGRITVLAGPTGSGKTTTMAKLAARLADKRKVGLIMADGFRVGAREQLGGYARLLGLPMEVASSPAEMVQALEKLDERDEILIDTPGQSGSPSDAAALSKLISVVPPAGRKLVWVISATADVRTLERARRAFAPVPLDLCIATKVDEAGTLAQAYNWLWDARLPLAHLATGQRVPDDLEVATSSSVARWLLGQNQALEQLSF